jgi:hypothetical protein
MRQIDYNKAYNIKVIVHLRSLSRDRQYMTSPNGLLSEAIEATDLLVPHFFLNMVLCFVDDTAQNPHDTGYE